MKEIKTINFELESVSPLKMDRWHGLPDPKTPEGYKKQAEEKVYRDDTGYIAIPSNAIKAVMRETAPELGRKMESKKNRQNIKAGVFFNKLLLSTGKKNFDVMSSDVVTRKGTGDKVTRVVTYRPMLNHWKVSGEMNLIGIEYQFARQCLELGGLRYGLLSHRPEFGRFIVKKFEEVDSNEKSKN